MRNILTSIGVLFATVCVVGCTLDTGDRASPADETSISRRSEAPADVANPRVRALACTVTVASGCTCQTNPCVFSCTGTPNACQAAGDTWCLGNDCCDGVDCPGAD